MVKDGTLAGVRESDIWIRVPCKDEEEAQRIAETMRRDTVVEFDDNRTLTAAQRKKTYVLLAYIADWWGYTPLEAAKEITKELFRGQSDTIHEEVFSLSDCDRTTARLYITYLIDFCLLHGIDTGEPLYKLCEDIPRYVWGCLMNKRCAVCGSHAEIHHVNAVGMGRNRKEICHAGMRCLPLCREHHTEIHKIGRETFLKKYLLEAVEIDERIAKVYHLKAR